MASIPTVRRFASKFDEHQIIEIFIVARWVDGENSKPNLYCFHSSLQLLTSPLIIPPTLEHVLQAGAMPTSLQAQASNGQSIKQENLLQGAWNFPTSGVRWEAPNQVEQVCTLTSNSSRSCARYVQNVNVEAPSPVNKSYEFISLWGKHSIN